MKFQNLRLFKKILQLFITKTLFVKIGKKLKKTKVVIIFFVLQTSYSAKTNAKLKREHKIFIAQFNGAEKNTI